MTRRKQAYLLCNFGRAGSSPATRTRKRGNENDLFKMSWDGRELLDEGTGHSCTGIAGAEAAKIYKIDGTWYLFLAEWSRPDPRKPDDPDASRDDRKQIVLRSKTDSIYGPYEKKVVFERGNGIIRSCSQGALMKAPDGSWWYTHQLIQNILTPFQGRPQCLEPVVWKDGWPLIGEDIDGDGIGEPVLHHKKPISGYPVAAPPTRDEFNAAKLGPQWEWNHNPRDTHWSLTDQPGRLRLRASVPVGKGDFWGACNTISQRIMGTTRGEAEARFDLSGMKPGQRGGFVRFGGVYHLLGVRVRADGIKQLFFNANGEEEDGPELAGNDLWIRTVNERDQARFAYSTDGREYTDIEPVFTIKFGKWTGDRLGFFCWNDKEETGYLDVDWFHYDYDGPKGNLPYSKVQ